MTRREAGTPDVQSARRAARDALAQCPEQYARARQHLREALQLMEADQ